MMKNYHQLVEINHNTNWPYIPDHPHGTLIKLFVVQDQQKLMHY